MVLRCHRLSAVRADHPAVRVLPHLAETEILTAVASPLIELVQPEELVKLGSGSSHKTWLLLEAMHRHGTGRRYAPLDVSQDACWSARPPCSRGPYPWLAFGGYVGDFTADLPRLLRQGRRLLAFLSFAGDPSRSTSSTPNTATAAVTPRRIARSGSRRPSWRLTRICRC